MPNGHAELLTLLPSSTVQDVRTKAQRAFGKKYLRLITAKNRVLVDFEKTLEEAEIEDGECLTAVVLQPQLAATKVPLPCGVMEMVQSLPGVDADYGGDSSAVGDQLRGVQQIQATSGAFAAILEDGSVVTWGNALCGGGSAQISLSCRFKPQIRPSLRFWKMDPSLLGEMHSVAEFGSSRSAQGCPADSSHKSGLCCDFGRWIRRYLGKCTLWRWQFGSSRSAQGVVQQIQATSEAFAAILEDGSVVTWGNALCGGDSSAVRDQLRVSQQIQATGGAFAAILEDGSVVTWGHAEYGGDSSAVRDQLKGVAADSSLSLVHLLRFWKMDPSLPGVMQEYGGDSSAVRDQLTGVQQIQSTLYGAFAAILEDESVVTWGNALRGGDSSAVRDQLKGVVQIEASAGAFAAILEDGSVVTWGHQEYGADSSEVRDQLR